MCLVTLAIASAVVSVAGTVASTVNAVSQASYQAKVADANARAKRQEADRKRTLAAIDAQAEMREGGKIVSQQRASLAAGGFDVNEGDAASLVAGSAATAAFNAQSVLNVGITEGNALDFQAENFESQASSLRSSIAPTILGGALQAGSSVAGAWYNAKRDFDLLNDGATA